MTGTVIRRPREGGTQRERHMRTEAAIGGLHPKPRNVKGYRQPLEVGREARKRLFLRVSKRSESCRLL